MDQFAARVPQFNLHGRTKVATILGGFISLLFFYATFLFAMHKFSHMVERKNPLITMNRENHYVDVTDETQHFETSTNEFMMAFAL